jgi:4-hydroxy-tetrahydrodipicolinate reductase
MPTDSVLRVAVSGAKGRMGREVVAAVAAASDMELVAQLDIGDDLGQALMSSKPDAMVDFTTPASVLGNILSALGAGVVPIVGTTGLSPDAMAQVRERCASAGIGALIAPNFALGAVLMMRFAAEAGRYFPDAEIVEMHHEKKLDSPSGTAILTAKRIADGRAGSKPTALPPDAHGLPGARGAAGDGAVPIHSVRLPGFVASQFVTFGGLGQTLTIRHDTLDRTSFMPGVLLALRKLDTIRAAKDVIYGLENLMD